MIGTMRSRVSFFMNKFRMLGIIDYNGGIEGHSSSLNLFCTISRNQELNSSTFTDARACG